MTRQERLLGWLVGRAIKRLHSLAVRRSDAHEMHHLLLAVKYGNSEHALADCPLMKVHGWEYRGGHYSW